MEAALDRLFAGSLDFPELEGRREGAAALYAFSPNYQGDRVLAVMAGLLGMVYAAFEHKDDFYVLDDLNEQKLYNCARNIEIAIWKLSSARNGQQVLLVSSRLTPTTEFEFRARVWPDHRSARFFSSCRRQKRAQYHPFYAKRRDSCLLAC
jgi:hypothetical protein